MQEALNNLYRGTQTDQRGEISGRGLGAFFLNPFVNEQELNKEEQKRRGLIMAANEGLNGEKLGIDGTQNLDTLGGTINTHKEEKRKAATASQREHELKPMAMELAAVREQNKVTEKRLDNQFALQYQRGLAQDKATEQARLDNLVYQRAQDRKDDLRYNENIARMERKDRKESLNTLIVGLSQLGAAFAA